MEVADSSWDRDLNKRRLYARAGIACYWIINIQGREVRVYTKPLSGEASKYEEELVCGLTGAIPPVSR